MINNRLSAAIDYAAKFRKWRVYAICDHDGAAVYVGSSTGPLRRYVAHKAGWKVDLSDWLSIVPHTFEVLDSYATRRMMIEADREYIGYLRPRFNVAWNPDAT